MIQKTTLHILLLTFILGLYFVFALHRITNDPIVRWDEYTNISVLEATASQKSFLDLKYHDGTNGNFYEKPPLWYWMGIIFSYLPGETIVNLRMISVISFIGILILVYKRIVKNFSSYLLGLLGILLFFLIPHLFFTNPGPVFSTHTVFSADLDFLQLLFPLGSLHCFNRYISLDSKKFIIIASLLVALAWLTKGPLGILPAIVFGFFRILELIQKKVEFKKIIKEFLLISTIFLVIVGPWIVYMYLNHGSVWINEFFGYHQIARLTTQLEGHTGNFLTQIQYFMSPHLNLLAIPTLLSTLYLLILHMKDISSKFHYFYPIISFLLIFLIIEIVHTKIAWYLIPLYPFEVLIIVMAIVDIWRKSRTKTISP